MVATLRLLAIASVAPAAVGLSQVQKRRAEGVATLSHAAGESMGNPNPLGAVLKSVQDHFAGHADTSHDRGSKSGAELEGRHTSGDSTGDSRQADAALTRTKRSGSRRLADMKSLKAATVVRLAKEDSLLEKVDQQNPVFDEMCRGMPDCKLSMCRWLQLSEKDTATGPCDLFEKNLKSCRGWEAPDQRAADAPAEDIDCAVGILRTASLGPAAVPEKVAALEACLAGLPAESMQSCPVSLTLLTDNIREWKKLQAADVQVAEIHLALDEEMPKARAALANQAGEAEEYEALAAIVQRSANLTSKPLVLEIAVVRELLDKLLKVPPARAELKRALARAEKSFATNNMYAVKEAIAWLDVALMGAAKTKVDVGPPQQAARDMMLRLEHLQTALTELATTARVANVSLQSKTSVEPAARSLDVAVQLSQAAGLAPAGLRDAKKLIHKLGQLHDAVAEVESRVKEGQAVIAVGGNKGMRSLNSSIRNLNRSLAKAEGLGLADNSSVTAALPVMDALSYAFAARQQLHSTLDAAQTLILQDGEALDDSKEEAMIDLLTPAIAWGEEEGFKNGIPEAKETLLHVRHMKNLKVRMRRALAQGNWSLESKGNLVMAKSVLREALRVEEHKNKKFGINVTAGQSEATSLVDALEALIQARGDLHLAEVVVNRTIVKHKGYSKAADGLNESIAAATALGLDAEAAVAAKKLARLRSFLDAKEALLQAVAEAAPARPTETVEVNDTITHAVFNRTGLRPKDLGRVSNDGDVDARIAALEKALADAAARGFVDPKMQKKLVLAKAAKAAAGGLTRAVHAGAVAMTFKEGVEQAVVTLRAALIDAEQAGIAVDLAGARKLLKRLEQIEPARAELVGAVLQGNASVKTEFQLSKSSVRLHEAIERSDHLYLNKSIDAAHTMSARVDELNEALLDVKAAIISGEESIKTDVGVEDAVAELGTALQEARRVNLTRDVATAQDLLTELTNMKQIADAVGASLMA